MNLSEIQLPDGQTMQLSLWTYPVAFPVQAELIQLWRTEWDKTDFDWLSAMNGDYSDTLTIQTIIGRVGGVAAGTASTYFAVDRPEVSLVGNVLTDSTHRRLGIGCHLTDAVVRASFATGCKVCYLGTTRSSRCVYLNCGFDWVSGGVMRRAAPGAADPEPDLFAPGQQSSIRAANWSDMPAMAVLVAQPLDCVAIDYPRGLLSPKHAPMNRCVSNFPVVYYNVLAQGGSMCVLAGEGSGRTLGFGSLTPGPGSGRRHLAVLDAVTHDHYLDRFDSLVTWLLQQAANIGVQTVQAMAAYGDHHKLEGFCRGGFEPIEELPDRLRLDGNSIAVTVLERTL